LDLVNREIDGQAVLDLVNIHGDVAALEHRNVGGGAAVHHPHNVEGGIAALQPRILRGRVAATAPRNVGGGDAAPEHRNVRGCAAVCQPRNVPGDAVEARNVRRAVLGRPRGITAQGVNKVSADGHSFVLESPR
jgi:hypothetical protein